MPDTVVTPEIAECSECGEPIRELIPDFWDHVEPELSGVDYVNWHNMARQRPCWMKAQPKKVEPSTESLLAQAREERDEAVALLKRARTLLDYMTPDCPCVTCTSIATYLAKIGAKR